MKITGYEVFLVVFSLCLSGCSNKDRLTQVTPKKRVFHRSTSKNGATQPTNFQRDGSLTIISQQPEKKLSKITIEFERADTPEKRAQGLMYRTKMDELQGMLFVFDDIAPRFFYMRNTYLSLDILFLDNDKKIVKIYHDTQPESEELLPSVADARYAFEVCAGFCKRHEVAEGDLLEF